MADPKARGKSTRKKTSSELRRLGEQALRRNGVTSMAVPTGGLAARLAAARAVSSAAARGGSAAAQGAKTSPWVSRNLAGKQTPKDMTGAAAGGSALTRKPAKKKGATVSKPKSPSRGTRPAQARKPVARKTRSARAS